MWLRTFGSGPTLVMLTAIGAALTPTGDPWNLPWLVIPAVVLFVLARRLRT